VHRGEQLNQKYDYKGIYNNCPSGSNQGLSIELLTSRKKQLGGMKTKLGRWACLRESQFWGAHCKY
jgi:hypothetical protein